MSFDVRPLARHIVTPVTAATFVVTAVTGIMLFARWNAGLVKFSHEWLSLAFAAMAAWHLARNWKTFLAYLKRHAALAAFGVSLVACVIVIGMTGKPPTAVSPGAVFGALSKATLETAAPAFGLAPAEAIAVLAAANITASGDDTLAAIGTRTGTGPAAIASLLATRGRR